MKKTARNHHRMDSLVYVLDDEVEPVKHVEPDFGEAEDLDGSRELCAQAKRAETLSSRHRRTA